MDETLLRNYDRLRAGETGFYTQDRGLIAVSGEESVRFLNGLVTNDVASLEDGGQILAAFPNAQGRLLAIVRVVRFENRFLFETEAATRQKLFDTLFRFTYAGDFFVEDLSNNFQFISVFGKHFIPSSQPYLDIENRYGSDYFVNKDLAVDFMTELQNIDAIEISEDLHEILRIESGIPRYGVDMDETTVVSELGIDGLISYNKGCYIGQEIIARIHFRGHVAKQLTGLLLEAGERQRDSVQSPPVELSSLDGKSAGRITSTQFSPSLDSVIALGYVRYDYLSENTELRAGSRKAVVRRLPFFGTDKQMS